MYDLEIGSDSGREWIEVYNSGTSDVDLSKWKLYEAETNHKIKSISEGGNTILSGGDYAILVDNPDKFYGDNPNFAGLILDTSFSLKNSGELLVIRNLDLIDIDSVDYLSDWGANGDGKSLQKISGEWISSSPSLGKINFIENIENEEGSVFEKIQEPTPTSSQSTNPVFIEVNIKAKIDSLEYLPIVGADFTFSGKALGLENEILENALYQWSFGDGTKGKGQSVLHNYAYPGKYMLVLEVISGEYSTSDKLKIEVIPSEIIISNVKIDFNDNFIELYNSSKYEINLSWWRLRVDNNYFTLPKNTILLPKSYLKLPYSVSGLLPKENSIVQLLYPNGILAFNFEKKENSNIKNEVSSFIKEEVEVVPKVPVLYSVEKPVDKIENISNNQIATISKSREVEPSEIMNDNGEAKKEEGFKFPINKWSFVLGGIVLVAVVGMSYTTKLDSENHKE